jgi:DNA polymerase I-like protein with 3'-5' exonuclease and polymerase domains
MQNLPKVPDRIPLPRALGRLVGAPPNLRAYIMAPMGFTFVGVDISQQELRILGHFVQSIGDWYREDPSLDLHNKVRDLILSVSGMELSRHNVKVTNFCTIYGGGANAISEQAGIGYEEAYALKQLHGQALPGIKRWDDFELHKGSTYFTVGGREYPVEDGKEYRDKNYAIQGSAGDQLKEIMLRTHSAAQALGGWIPLTAHDELLTCVQTSRAAEMRSFLDNAIKKTGLGGQHAMFDVPMLGETYQGKRWLK